MPYPPEYSHKADFSGSLVLDTVAVPRTQYEPMLKELERLRLLTDGSELSKRFDSLEHQVHGLRQQLEGAEEELAALRRERDYWREQTEFWSDLLKDMVE